MKLTVTLVLAFIFGVAAGGYLFAKSLPRSFLNVSACEGSCYRPNDLAGLLASAAIQRVPGLLPSIAGQSPECIALNHPFPEGRIHFVLFPKRDVKNILELTVEDAPFVLGCFALGRELMKGQPADNYRVITNGPRLQHVTYLHFHIIAK
ncbi:MAG: HIT domain-containing protein [Rhodocyclaceae bacterium]|nr:HIT domain-containing protein [Rhodocyclaceae bacterium]MCA3147252.1 HIT domain-containing protein [Rhodocyclaceae bacterium]